MDNTNRGRRQEAEVKSRCVEPRDGVRGLMRWRVIGGSDGGGKLQDTTSHPRFVLRIPGRETLTTRIYRYSMKSVYSPTPCYTPLLPLPTSLLVMTVAIIPAMHHHVDVGVIAIIGTEVEHIQGPGSATMTKNSQVWEHMAS